MENGMIGGSLSEYIQNLEQCREHLLLLAEEGQDAVNAEVIRAEQELQTQITKLEQSRKITAFSLRQYEVVDQALTLEEEQLKKAREEEDDARTALEAVQNIMGDAGFLRFAEDLDMTHIMKKAENVLGDTILRAEENLRLRVADREQAELALVSRRAGEKVAFFTLVQSECFSDETELSRVYAERTRDVLRETQEILRLTESGRELENSALVCADELKEMEQSLGQTEEILAGSIRDEAAFRLEAEQEYAAAQRENEKLLAELNGRIQACVAEQEAAETERADAMATQSRRRENAAAATLRNEQVQAKGRETVAAAERSRDESIAAMEDAIRELTRQSEEKVAAAAAARDTLARCTEECESLRAEEEAQKERCRVAEEERITAAEAVRTAESMAERTLKIRGALNTESSDLLKQAEEVLMEAVNSARDLLNQREHACSARETALANIQSRLADADRVWKEAALRADSAKSDEDFIRQRRQNAILDGEQARKDAESRADAVMEQTRSEMEEARRVAEEENDLLARADAAMENASQKLSRIRDEVDHLVEHRNSISEAGREKLRQIRNRADQTALRMKEQIVAAESQTRSARVACETKQEQLRSLRAEVERMNQRISEQKDKVTAFITDAASELSLLADRLDSNRMREEEARLAAEAAVAEEHDYKAAHSPAPVAVEEEVVEEPAVEEPVIEELPEDSVIEEPVIEEPAVEEIAADESICEEAVFAEESVAEEAPEVPVTDTFDEEEESLEQTLLLQIQDSVNAPEPELPPMIEKIPAPAEPAEEPEAPAMSLHWDEEFAAPVKEEAPPKPKKKKFFSFFS